VRAGHLWLASFAALLLAGWPLLAHASYRRFSLPARIGLSFAVGAVLASAWMTILALVGIPWQPFVLIVLACATAFLLRFLLPAGRPTLDAPRKVSATGVEKLALALLWLALLAAFAASASSRATSPDLMLFWAPKAQAFAAARTIDASFLRDISLIYMHRSYPPLVTNLMAFATLVTARFAWGAATLTLPMLLGVLALALPGTMGLLAPRRSALAASALIVATLGYLGLALSMAGNGDPWLWLFEILALAILAGPAALSPAGQLLAGLFLAGAVTAKVEGLLFAAASMALFLLLRRTELRIGRALALLAVPSVLSLGAWFAFEALQHIFLGYEQYGRFFDVHWDRLLPVVASLGRAFWSTGWALPYLLPLAALLFVPGKTRIRWLPIGVSLFLGLFSVFTYLHGDPDPGVWIIWSAGRVFSTIPAFLVLAAVCRGTPIGASGDARP
jgi:hypothetical protein